MPARYKTVHAGAGRRNSAAEALQLPQAPAGVFFCAECGHILSTRDEFKLHQETVHNAVNLAESDTEEEDDTAAAPPPRDATKTPARTKRTRSRHRSKRGSPAAPTTARTAAGGKGLVKQRADTSSGLLNKPCLDALSPPDVQSNSKGANSASQTARGVSMHQGGRSRQRLQEPSAASGPTAVSAKLGHANGLHVDVALSAAQHAVQELWVPVRKPTPGAGGSKVTLLRRPALPCDAETAAAQTSSSTAAAAAVSDTTATATTAGDALASAASAGTGRDLLAAPAGDASLSGGGGDAAGGVPVRGRGRSWARARARGRPLTSSRAATREAAGPSMAAAGVAASSTEAAAPGEAGSVLAAPGEGTAAVADRAASSSKTPSRGRGKGRSRYRQSEVSNQQQVQVLPSVATTPATGGAGGAAAVDHRADQDSAGAAVARGALGGKGRGRGRKGRTVVSEGGGVVGPDVRVVWRPKAVQPADMVTQHTSSGSAPGSHGLRGPAPAAASTSAAAAAGQCAPGAEAGQGQPAASKATSTGVRRYGRRRLTAAAPAGVVTDRGSPAAQGSTGLHAATAGLAGLAIA